MEKMEKNLELFLKLSVHLTGFSEMELYGTGMITKYYKELEKRIEKPARDSYFLKVKTILDSGTDIEIINKAIGKVLLKGDCELTTKRIIAMWYKGEWIVEHSRWPELISGEAFIQGLMWPAAKTHPPAAKQPGFGSWSDKPFFK